MNTFVTHWINEEFTSEFNKAVCDLQADPNLSLVHRAFKLFQLSENLALNIPLAMIYDRLIRAI